MLKIVLKCQKLHEKVKNILKLREKARNQHSCEKLSHTARLLWPPFSTSVRNRNALRIKHILLLLIIFPFLYFTSPTPAYKQIFKYSIKLCGSKSHNTLQSSKSVLCSQCPICLTPSLPFLSLFGTLCQQSPV